MDNRPIGIFDSGVGGLTAVRALRAAAPGESVVYFGDTARVPYGNRTKEDITKLSLQDARFLRTHDPKAILIACNTITASCIDELRQANPDIPVIGVVASAAAVAAGATRNGRIGLIATQATVNSGIYERRLEALLPSARVYTQGSPKLVPLIESGHIARGDAELEAAVAEYLEPIRAQGVDVVILGCTHYPIIRETVQAYMGEGVTLVDSGGASASAVLEALEERGSLAGGAMGTGRYYCSARLSEFEAIAQRFWGESIHGHAVEIDIEQY